MTTTPQPTLALGQQVLPDSVLPSRDENNRPRGLVVVVRDVETRKVSSHLGPAGPGSNALYISTAADRGGVPFLAERWVGAVPDYIGYHGELVDDPVNQVPLGRLWRKACGTFAHHIASFSDHWHMLREPGFYSSGHNFTHTDESRLRNRVTLWWGIGVNGEAYRQVEEWMALDPIIDPNAHADLNWKVVQVSVADLMEKVCDNCQGFNILRRFNRRCEPLNWQTLLSGGMIALPDFEEEEWGPRSVIRNFVNLSSSAKRDIWDGLAQWNDKALEYYDENIASR